MTDSQQLATKVLELHESATPMTLLKSMTEVWSLAPELAREVLRIPGLEAEQDEALERVKVLEAHNRTLLKEVDEWRRMVVDGMTPAAHRRDDSNGD